MNEAELRAWRLAYETEIAEAIHQARQAQRCETCRWWGGHIDYPNAVPVDERFGDGALPDGKRYCALTYTYRGHPSRPTLAESAGIPDGILYTVPDFSCNQHEPNP